MDLRDEYLEASGHIALIPIAEGYQPKGEFFSIFYVKWLERELIKARLKSAESQATDA
jgi:hypothetical protein